MKPADLPGALLTLQPPDVSDRAALWSLGVMLLGLVAVAVLRGKTHRAKRSSLLLLHPNDTDCRSAIPATASGWPWLDWREWDGRATVFLC